LCSGMTRYPRLIFYLWWNTAIFPGNLLHFSVSSQRSWVPRNLFPFWKEKVSYLPCSFLLSCWENELLGRCPAMDVTACVLHHHPRSPRSTRVWTQDLALATQVLYHLSHTPRPFCFSLFFSDKVLCFLTGVGLRPQSFYLHLQPSWDYRHTLPYPVYFWDKFLLTFTQVGLKPWSTHLRLPHGWDSRCSPTHPAPVCTSVMNCSKVRQRWDEGKSCCQAIQCPKQAASLKDYYGLCLSSSPDLTPC
jgi:hypothetical protein